MNRSRSGRFNESQMRYEQPVLVVTGESERMENGPNTIMMRSADINTTNRIRRRIQNPDDDDDYDDDDNNNNNNINNNNVSVIDNATNNNAIISMEKTLKRATSRRYNGEFGSNLNKIPQDYLQGKFKGKLDGLDKLLFNRSMSHMLTISSDGTPVITVPLKDQTVAIDINNYRGRSYFSKGQVLSLYDNTSNKSTDISDLSLFDYGCTIKWNKLCFTVLNAHDEIIAKCFDSTANRNNKDGVETTIVYGICPMSTRDKALELVGTPNLYRWMQVKINTRIEDAYDVDLCSENFYTPLWKIRRYSKCKNLVSIRSIKNDAIVAWIAMGGPSTTDVPSLKRKNEQKNWTLKTRLGLDPAMFISIVGVLLRHEEKRRQLLTSRATSPSRIAAMVGSVSPRNKSFVSLPYHRRTDPDDDDYNEDGQDKGKEKDAAENAKTDAAPKLPSRSKSWDATAELVGIYTSFRTLSSSQNTTVRSNRKEKGPLRKKGAFKHSTVFKVVHGVVVSPFRASALSQRNPSSASQNELDDPNIWVGPEEIIRDRYLNKREESKSRIYESYHLRLSIENLRTCFQAGKRVQVQDAVSKSPFISGSLVILRNTSFVLKDSDGMRVAKCLEDPANQTSLILGVSPLFESDRLRKQRSGSTAPTGSGTATRTSSNYFPWLQVTITDGDMAIDLWTGHSYTSLWYCERIQQSSRLAILSAENDDQVIGEFTVRAFGSMDVTTTAGLDPAIFICLAVVILRYKVAQTKNSLSSINGDGSPGADNDASEHVPRRTSSKVFRVVNGEVVVPFHAQSMDFDESEVEEAMMEVTGTSNLGIWVGPDEVIQGRYLNKQIDTNSSVKLKLALLKPALRLVFPSAGITNESSSSSLSSPVEEDCTKIENTETSLPYPGCSKIRWTATSFFVSDNQKQQTAICMEDMKNLTCLVCGTCPLFPTDEPIERTDIAVYYPWLQVRLEDEDLCINLWSGHGYTALWYAENILNASGFYDVLSAEFDTCVGKLRHDNGQYESIAGTNVDPSIFVCLSAIMYRFVTVQKNDDKSSS